MALKIITCPWCGKEARITYEENRVYQMKCYSCQNTMLHEDLSFDRAVEFFEHHADLLQAEKAGRQVVLPCKAGDRVWVGGKEAIVVCFFGYKTERYLRAQLFDNVEYIDIPFYEIGKTVFLTRKEAEKALKEKGDSMHESVANPA